MVCLFFACGEIFVNMMGRLSASQFGIPTKNTLEKLYIKIRSIHKQIINIISLKNYENRIK